MENNKYWQDGEKLEPLYLSGGTVSGAAAGETVWLFLKKLNADLPFDWVIPLGGVYPEELKTGTQTSTCTCMSIASLFTIAKMWKQPRGLSTDEWINKNEVYPCNRMLFNLKKEQHGWTPKHCAGWKKLDKKGHVLYDSIYRKIQNR